MPIVADIIASVKHKHVGEKESATALMEDLLKQAEEANLGICEALLSRYESLTQALLDSRKLQDKVDGCLSSISNTENKIREEVLGNVESSVGEVGRVSRRWKEVTGELEAARTLLEIHNLLEESHRAKLNQEFFLSAQHLNQIESCLIAASQKDVESQLEVVAALREELIIRRTDLIFRAAEAWTKFIVWEEEELKDGSKSCSLFIRSTETFLKSEKGREGLDQIFMTLHSLGELQRRVRQFGKKLMELFFRPVICDCARVEVLHRDDAEVISVIRPGAEREKTRHAVESLHRIQEIFEFLNLVFTKVIVDNESRMSFMTLMGQEIGEDFTKLILKDCIAEAIPCKRNELGNFERVQQKAEEMNEFLVSIDFDAVGLVWNFRAEAAAKRRNRVHIIPPFYAGFYMGFFSSDQKSLLDYAANVETVFSNKACANLLAKARDLMVKPLHVTATIGPLSPGKPLVAYDEAGNELEKTTAQLEKLLAVNTFNLPKCQVSISACHLVDLIYETMEEACASSPEYAGRLFYTVRNILSLYTHIVPTAFSHTLSTIPQHAALVHNNSMFMAHHAFLLEHQYRNRLPAALRDSTLTTADLAHLLRKTGCEVFLSSMQTHRSTLLATLREGLSLPSLGCEVSAVSSAEMSVKQCVSQLQRLHSVWQKVLPYSVYTKSIGALVSAIVEDVILRIVGLQDISADVALGLINVLSLLKDNIPPLFVVEGEPAASEGDVMKEVRLWAKMNELIIVLGASLRELVDRWSEGKGPLALHFTPEEAKQLIRALFQNTERRAHVLARIK